MPMQYDPDSWPACWVLELVAAGDVHPFYNSGYWKRLKRSMIDHKPTHCELCAMKQPAELTPLRKPGEKKKDKNDKRPVAIFHHIHPLRERPDLALSEYDDKGELNIAIICPSCHWDEHHKRFLPVTSERW